MPVDPGHAAPAGLAVGVAPQRHAARVEPERGDDALEQFGRALALAAPRSTAASGQAAARRRALLRAPACRPCCRPRCTGTSSAPTSLSTVRDRRHAPVPVVGRRVDHVQQQRRRRGTSSSVRAERRDQRVRQPIDEPDRVRHEQLALIRQPHLAQQRVQRHEQRVRGYAPLRRSAG
ncbi:MAG: hypothetical protein MZV64_72935 [Ignavibacteriales bacterium]|nr:hypothetical protein [Ignavibacteriales bacterium]